MIGWCIRLALTHVVSIVPGIAGSANWSDLIVDGIPRHIASQATRSVPRICEIRGKMVAIANSHVR